jgi:hypothetical protein
MRTRRYARNTVRPVLWVLAIAYFLIDALSVALLKPVGRWLDTIAPLHRITAWIKSLGPYQSLFLFAVPLILLEPVKPVALYLLGTGRFYAGMLVLLIGEAVKIFILERLFKITRPKLMSFRAFAWAYDHVIEIAVYLRSLKTWKASRKLFGEIRAIVRRAVKSPRPAIRDRHFQPVRR